MKFLSNYFIRHCQAAVNSLGQLSRAPLASIMTCFVIGITLALPTALFVALKNFGNIGGNLQQTMQVTAYLKSQSKEKEVIELGQTLEANPKVASVKIISPEQGLKELQQQIGFTGSLEELPDNPLPWAIVIVPKLAKHLETLSQTLQDLPLVDSVQSDKAWVKRLASLMSLAERAVYALTIFLGIAVFLIINNAIRGATQQNQKEIEIIKLIGGTYSFIRRPFLYAGMLYGLLGGIIAWQLVDILILFLKNPILELADLYNSQFQLIGIGLRNTLILLTCSMLLGFMGSWLAVTRQLKKC
ncbi:MAG: permease-like cell division protein FtsX [Gammaproteobacteria bacterium]